MEKSQLCLFTNTENNNYNITTVNTRKLSTLVCLFLAGTLIFSCSEDDGIKDNIPEITNSFVYDNQVYSIADGLIEDIGPYPAAFGEENPANSHYVYTFLFTDGAFRLEEYDWGNSYDNDNATYRLYVSLYYPDTTAFKEGEYSYVHIPDATTQDVINKKVFGRFAFWLDLNGNGVYDSEDEETYTHSAGGTVNVRGSNNDYTIWFDITMTNGKTLTGSAQKTFKYFRLD